MRHLFALALACCLVTAASAQIWDNGPNAGGAMSSQLDTAYPFHSQIADDFLLPTGPGGEPAWNVTHVEWHGGYWSGNPVPPDFNIIFYADDGTGNAPTGGPGDPTPTALVVHTLPYAAVGEVFNGVDYDYAATLPTPFVANANTKYWLAIQSIFNFPPQWGWNTSGIMTLHECVMGFPLLGNNYWTNGSVPFGTPRDATFRLYGNPVPEPATLGLLAVGALALLRRR